MTITDAVDRIRALRRVTQETGCVTRRAQSELLASLSHDVLMEVALILQYDSEKNGTDNVSKPHAR